MVFFLLYSRWKFHSSLSYHCHRLLLRPVHPSSTWLHQAIPVAFQSATHRPSQRVIEADVVVRTSSNFNSSYFIELRISRLFLSSVFNFIKPPAGSSVSNKPNISFVLINRTVFYLSIHNLIFISASIVICSNVIRLKFTLSMVMLFSSYWTAQSTHMTWHKSDCQIWFFGTACVTLIESCCSKISFFFNFECFSLANQGVYSSFNCV